MPQNSVILTSLEGTRYLSEALPLRLMKNHLPLANTHLHITEIVADSFQKMKIGKRIHAQTRPLT